MTEQPNKTQEKQASARIEPDEADLRLDRWFRRHHPAVSQGQLQKWLRTGQVRVDGKRAEAKTRLESGQMIRLPPVLKAVESAAKPMDGSGKRPIRQAEKLKSLVLYEDDDVIALNKPAGLAVQGGTGLKENLDDSLMVFSRDGQTRPKLVHRLDRETSGVLLIARTAFAATRLAASFKERATKKIYWAVTSKPLPRDEGMIDAPLVRRGQIMVVPQEDEEEDDDVKSAKTLYHVLENIHKGAAFVALWPLTGRTHQLRAHMAHIGAPLLGDPLYKGDEENRADLASTLPIGKGLHLHARRLILPHPRKGMIDVTAPLSSEMKKTWRCFGFSEKHRFMFDDD